ncbi:hypothetical protein QRX50_36015 [Amycolatopsis carbonis]|uniref:Uncharacterized protein n=1 Tax=Amycolatopsis carbonis TaxID=715471 RepID=A0A9Y2IBQ3_9PSEU|nr:hypothetical protein [Amycolatopsis sp. 2-15]WIX76802.1 hypothetical protein QRX50_36015 [Amycolatopsis sp. 2-15]
MHLPQVAIAMLVNDRDEVLYRPIIGLQIGINRILEHLGAAPVTDADINGPAYLRAGC